MDNRGALAVRKRVIRKLVRGRQVATQLQNLIDKPVRDRGAVDVEDLALQILRSFTDSLSEITSPRADSTPISSVSSDERSQKLPPVKNGRGCYKRRRTSDSRIVMSTVEEDGYAWRKYGQKVILNSQFPRCYYRCTHKQQGCKALKQVQKIKEDPTLYQITYIREHTCSCIHPSRPPYELVGDRYSHHATNIISFQSSTDSPDPTTVLTIDYDHTATHVAPTPSLKEEADTQSDDHQDTSKSDAKSSLLKDALREIMGYSCIWEARASCVSSSFEEIDIYGQFPDIENFQFDD